ncbi:MAG: SpoIIE family protein phosphatase [Actinobacteria bacterium]|uniref:Unannotated protein n=1 Tax=freshwater metagenome TaxID=449393 RepID=A0A6J6RL99_9ZZZZ|nr:SpoIIE family protein phosphatase [Actinomycetota bacterium]
MTSTITEGVDTSFDRYARMVRRALGVPVALVSLVEAERQVFVGAEGLPSPVDVVRETPLSHSFCQWVVKDEAPVVTSDARLDERLHSNLAIPELGVVAYAGWPVTDHTGAVIGSLCAIDDQPREWTDGDLATLEDLAAACSTELAQRGLRDQAATGARHAEELSHRSRVLLALSEALSSTYTLGEVATAVQQVSLTHLGCLRAGIWLTDGPDATTLRFLPPTGAEEWESAAINAALALDRTNPLGDALLANEPILFATAEQQNAIYTQLDLRAQVGRSRAFWPLAARGRAFGAMALIWDDERVLSADERTTIGALSSYAAQAIQRALLVQEQLDALITLQSALLPGLPDVGHLELAARYRPAAARDQVGGDWYDAVVMPSGATNLMIGDVVGHDIAAAATMGQMRNMLRAIAWSVDDAPSQNVTRLDQALVDLEVDGMASLVYARIEPTAEGADGPHQLRWTSAGHPPPVVVDPEGTARFLDEGAADLMVGVDPSSARTDRRTDIEAGSTLLLYTDGLVERRTEHLDGGLARLLTAIERHHDQPVGAFLDRVLTDLIDARLDDDVAVLAVRFAAPS